MDLSFSSLMCGFTFGVFGLYFLKQGRTKGKPAQVLIGLTLMIYPYLISNPVLAWGIGILLCVLGFRR